MTRKFQQRVFAYCKEVGDDFEFTGNGTASSNGAADGTTLIDAGGTANSGSGDTYNGRYLVEMLSGNNKGLFRLVVDDNGSGTLTLEGNGFPSRVDSGDEYRIWKHTMPVAVVDSSSGETNMVDAVRNEANDFWNGYYAVPLTGNRAGEVGEITDFVGSSGTFTLASGLGGALAAGDVVLLLRFVEAVVEVAPTQGYIQRPINRVNFARGKGRQDVRGGQATLTIPVVGSGSLAASGSVANKSNIADLLEACGLEEQAGTSMQAQSGGSTTSVPIGTGTHENVEIGQAIQIKGNVTYVTAKTDGGGSDDTLTVSPPLPFTPVSGDDVNASRSYVKTTDGTVNGVTVITEHDGIRHIMFGCKGTIEDVNQDSFRAFNITLTPVHWIRAQETFAADLNGTYSTAQMIRDADRVCHFDTTKTDIGGWTATPETTVGPKTVSGRNGVNGVQSIQLTNIQGGATLNEIMESTADVVRHQAFGAETEYAVSVVHGSHGNCYAVRLPRAVIIDDPTVTDQESLVGHPTVLAALDAGTAEDPASGTVKVPDWSIHIF